MSTPGQVHARRAATQLRDFSGLVFERGISPTDVDCFLDFGGEEFVIVELKHIGTPLPKGQELALTRLADAVQAPTQVMLVVAEHDCGYDDIDVSSCIVDRIYWRGQWRHPSRPRDVRDLIDSWRAYNAGGWT